MLQRRFQALSFQLDDVRPLVRGPSSRHTDTAELRRLHPAAQAALINPAAGTDVDLDDHHHGRLLTHVRSDPSLSFSGISTKQNATDQLIKGGDCWEVDYKSVKKA